ncbi:MAG: RES domain-containing protein [Rhodomicrobium sp.]
MKPIPNWLSEGRANPRGIPYLYLASTRDTALAEVRPWIGSHITVWLPGHKAI